MRVEGEGTIFVHYGKELTLTEFATTAPLKVTQETDFTAKISLDGLEPWTPYYYRVVVVGGGSAPKCRFVTAPEPDALADVRFAFGGDLRERFKPFTIMDSIHAMRPDFLLFLGDTIYADRDGVATALSQFWAKYAANRNDLPTQRLFSETSLYATWDDHEVANDYLPSHPLAPIGRRAFFDYWPVRQDPEDPNRLYRSFRWGKAVEVFILDTRQYRDPAAGTMLGEKQKEWLLEALSSSTALFKFIATSVPLSGTRRDQWGGFPKERDEILSFIANRRIGGVVFLAGDAHYAAVTKLPRLKGLMEVVVGPLAGRLNRFGIGTPKRSDFFSNNSFSYGMVKVVTEGGLPYAEVDILDEDNKLLYRTRIDPTPSGG